MLNAFSLETGVTPWADSFDNTEWLVTRSDLHPMRRRGTLGPSNLDKAEHLIEANSKLWGLTMLNVSSNMSCWQFSTFWLKKSLMPISCILKCCLDVVILLVWENCMIPHPIYGSVISSK